MAAAFEPENLPSRRFHPRVYGVGAWTDNLHFACDLVAALKPRVLVELGTDRGESYFAFCQSVAENKTSTRCFAVDSWTGDQHAGGYDETTFAEVSTHNRAHYAGFSTLMRCSFDEALEKFAPESVDLLHLDGLHTEAAVRHDLEAWLPKLAPGAILILHDVSVRSRGFGVWKVWEELRERGRAFTFAETPGLAVWQKPPSATLPNPVAILLDAPSSSSARLIQYYHERANELQAMIAQQWRDGTIRQTAVANQTVIQIFHTHDGIHREEDSVLARIGHETWKDLSIPLPSGAGAAPLRIDFLSAFTVIDLGSINLTSENGDFFTAPGNETFDDIRIGGDAQRIQHPRYLRLQITGPDPQLYLPPLTVAPDQSALCLELRLRVSAGKPRED